MGKIGHKRVAAATIIEAIVAMVIMLVVFAITTTVLVQTSVRSFSIKKIKATQLVNAYFLKTVNEKTFFDEEISLDEFKIKKNVQQYGRNAAVLAIRIIVFDNNDKELESGQRLIRYK